MRNKHIYGEDKPHWLWKLVGMALAMLALSMAGAYIAEHLA